MTDIQDRIPDPAPLPFEPFRDADYPAWFALLRRAGRTAASSDEETRRRETVLPPGHALRRSVLRDPATGALVGGATAATDGAGRGVIAISVVLDPAARARLADAYREARRLAAAGEPRALVASVREDDAPLRALLAVEGFVERERSWRSTLDLRAFDPAPWGEPEARAAAGGARLATLADLRDDEPTRRRLYEAMAELLRDVPFDEPLAIYPYDVWLERVWRSLREEPELTTLALVGDGPDAEIAGVSGLRSGAEPDRLETGLTGVRAPWRRRGLGTALKLAALRRARALGAASVGTTNHSVNRPMLAINEALGFVKEPAWIRVKLPLRPAGAPPPPSREIA